MFEKKIQKSVKSLKKKSSNKSEELNTAIMQSKKIKHYYDVTVGKGM